MTPPAPVLHVVNASAEQAAAGCHYVECDV